MVMISISYTFMHLMSFANKNYTSNGQPITNSWLSEYLSMFSDLTTNTQLNTNMTTDEMTSRAPNMEQDTSNNRNMVAEIGMMLDSNEALAMVCPTCFTTTLMMHPVWNMRPHKETIEYIVSNKIKIQIVCLNCSEHENDPNRLTMDVAMKLGVVKNMKLFSNLIVYVVEETDETLICNTSQNLFSNMIMGLHVVAFGDVMEYLNEQQTSYITTDA